MSNFSKFQQVGCCNYTCTNILAPPKAQFDLDRQKGHERSKVAFYASKSTWVMLKARWKIWKDPSLQILQLSSALTHTSYMSAVVLESDANVQQTIHQDFIGLKLASLSGLDPWNWWCKRQETRFMMVHELLLFKGKSNQSTSKLYQRDSNPRQLNMIRTQVDSRAHKTEPRHSWAQVPCPNLLCWAGVVGLIIRKETGLLKLSSFHFLVKLLLSDSVKSSDQHQE